MIDEMGWRMIVREFCGFFIEFRFCEMGEVSYLVLYDYLFCVIFRIFCRDNEFKEIVDIDFVIRGFN